MPKLAFLLSLLLAASLGPVPGAEALSLSGGDLGPAAAGRPWPSREALAKVLPENLAELSLDLGYTKIGNGGLEALAQRLPENLARLSLNLGYTKIGNGGLEALAQRLPENLAKLSLNLAGTKIGNGGLEALAQRLPENLARLSLDLGATKITDASLVAVLRGMPWSISDFTLLAHAGGFATHVQGRDVASSVLFETLEQEAATANFFEAFFSDGEEDILVRNDAQRTLFMVAQAYGLTEVAEALSSMGGDPTSLILLRHSSQDRRFWAALCGAFALSVAAVAMRHRMAGAASHRLLADEETNCPQRSGAILLAARAIAARESRFGKAGVLLAKAFRSLEIVAQWILLTGPVMYVLGPHWVVLFVAVANVAPAVRLRGSQLIKMPVLIAVSGGKAEVAVAIARLMLAFAVVWQTYQSMLPELNFAKSISMGNYPSMLSGTALLPWPQAAWSLPGYWHWLSNPRATSILSLRAWYVDTFVVAGLGEQSIDLGFVFTVFVYTTLCSAPVWMLGSLTSGQRSLDQEKVLELAARIDAAVARESRLELEEMEESEGIKLVRAKPTGILELGLVVKLLFLLLDLYTDLSTIFIMLITGNYAFAFILLSVFLISILMTIAEGSLKALPQEVRETLRLGVPTDALLSVMDREVGLEAFVSTAVTTYAIPYTCTSAPKMLNAFVSITLACWNLGNMVHEQLDLQVGDLSLKKVELQPFAE